MSAVPVDDPPSERRERALGILALACVALALVVTAVPGIFTIDEDNYIADMLAVRAGRLSVAGTDGLPPSVELLGFDPASDERVPNKTPVVTTAPPLYAPIAAPASFLGIYGLIAINAIALVVAAGLAFGVTRRVARSRAAPYLAAVSVLFAGYSIEYAQGIWPHMLSMMLVFGAFAAAVRAQDDGSPRLAALAGLLAGIACGVRYPNALSAAAIGLGLLLFSARRVRAVLAYVAGASLPLLYSTAVNHSRLGIRNPISKGGGYLQPGEAYAPRWLDTIRCAVARIVDFDMQAPLQGHAAWAHPYLKPSLVTGVYVVGGAVKKAWIQSMPWVALSLVVLALAFRRREAGTQTRALRSAALVVLATVGAVAISGASRVDGYGFNQRYFIDMLPFVVLALVAAVDGTPRSPRALVAAAAGTGVVLLAVFLLPSDSAVRQHALTKVPLALAAALIAAYAARGRRRGVLATNVALAASLVWAAGVHLADDVVASRALRESNAERLARASIRVRGPAALFTCWGGRDPFGPLALDRDVLVLDVWPDDGEAAPALRDELLRRGRHVYVAEPLPARLLERVAGEHPVRALGAGFFEILP
jgi:hypothetical protein